MDKRSFVKIEATTKQLGFFKSGAVTANCGDNTRRNPVESTKLVTVEVDSKKT